MASEKAREIAASAWCHPDTSATEMDVVLAERFAEALDVYIHALQWCGGSDDFALGGKARKGWEKICRPLLT